jgi:hypothetical protein
MIEIGCGAASEDRERLELAKVSCLAARFAGTFTLDRRRMRYRLPGTIGCWLTESLRRGCRVSTHLPFRVGGGVIDRRADLRFNVLAARRRSGRVCTPIRP